MTQRKYHYPREDHIRQLCRSPGRECVSTTFYLPPGMYQPLASTASQAPPSTSTGSRHTDKCPAFATYVVSRAILPDSSTCTAHANHCTFCHFTAPVCGKVATLTELELGLTKVRKVSPETQCGVEDDLYLLQLIVSADKYEVLTEGLFSGCLGKRAAFTNADGGATFLCHSGACLES